jgi:UDP-N-acetylmuramoylalanine--D-glutamate ligase
MKIGIVGWGVEGQSAFKFYGPQHEYLIVNEHPRDDFPAENDRVKVQFLNAPAQIGITSQANDFSYLDGIADCDKIIYSVTSAKNLEQLYPANDKFWSKAATVQHIFFDEVKTKNIIGVTGTKGKGTTSTLITKMLETSGKTVHLGGNIGRSVLDFVRDVKLDDWVVLELSNFQLYKLDRSPHISVCLMIAKEHMDWHPDMPDYLQAKGNIFRHQKNSDIAIYLNDNFYSKQLAGESPGKRIPYFAAPGARVRGGSIVIGEDETELLKTSEVKLLGEHNLQNICAAATAVWQVEKSVEAIAKVAASFSGLEHRLEFVRELNGVKYYDDSFGTTPDTALVALQSFTQPVILIVGGHDKGADYEQLAVDILDKKVKHVIVIGKIADRISTVLRKKGFSHISFGLNSMAEIVAEARRQSAPGDVVLLSAGTSSFGMFKDYKDRGNQFKQAVKALSSTD